MLKAWIKYKQRVREQFNLEHYAEQSRLQVNQSRKEAADKLADKLICEIVAAGGGFQHFSAELVCLILLVRIEALEAAQKKAAVSQNWGSKVSAELQAQLGITPKAPEVTK